MLRVANWREQEEWLRERHQHLVGRSQLIRSDESLSALDDAFYKLVGFRVGEDLSLESVMRKQMAQRMEVWEAYTGVAIGSREFDEMVDNVAAALSD